MINWLIRNPEAFVVWFGVATIGLAFALTGRPRRRNDRN